MIHRVFGAFIRAPRLRCVAGGSGILPAIFFVLALASRTCGLEILPSNQVAPFQLVHIKFNPDNNGVCFVVGIKDGKFIRPDVVQLRPGYIVFCGPPGSYMVQAQENGNFLSETLEILPVNPDIVPPKPPPQPDPPPVPDVGFRVLMLEETADRGKLPRSQAALLISPSIRGYLSSKCTRGPDGKTPEWRLWDDDLTDDQLKFETEYFRKSYRKAVTEANGRLPWIYINNGAASFPMPQGESELLTQLKKYGGE